MRYVDILHLTISAWESIHVNLWYESHDVKPASSPNLNFQQQNKLFMLTIYIRNFSSDATLLFILYVRRYHLRVNVIFSAVIIDNRLFFLCENTPYQWSIFRLQLLLYLTLPDSLSIGNALRTYKRHINIVKKSFVIFCYFSYLIQCVYELKL